MRFLYIALAAALLGGPAAPVARAQVDCSVASPGTLCEDDADPCTTDTCAGGVCTHVDVPNRTTCDPVIDAYRRTLGLADLLDELTADLAGMALPDTARVLVVSALDMTRADLARASDALAGRLAIPPPAPGETIAQARARSAFGIVRGMPPRVRSVVRVLAVPAVRSVGGPGVLDAARRVRFLYRSTNQLKRELRRLQIVTGVFSR